MQFKTRGTKRSAPASCGMEDSAGTSSGPPFIKSPHEKARIDDRSIGGIAFGPIVEGGDEVVSDTGIADFGIAELGKRHDKPFFLTLRLS